MKGRNALRESALRNLVSLWRGTRLESSISHDSPVYTTSQSLNQRCLRSLDRSQRVLDGFQNKYQPCSQSVLMVGEVDPVYGGRKIVGVGKSEFYRQFSRASGLNVRTLQTTALYCGILVSDKGASSPGKCGGSPHMKRHPHLQSTLAEIQTSSNGLNDDSGGYKALNVSSEQDKGEAEADKLVEIARRETPCQYHPSRPKARSNV